MTCQMVCYLLSVRPYVQALSMTLSVVNEAFLFVILCTTSRFVDPLLGGKAARAWRSP